MEWRIRAVAAEPASTEVVAHGLQLLHLVGGKDGGELVVGVLEDCLGLLAALVLGEAGVAAQFAHLLLLRGEDRLELRGLVSGEVEALAEMLRRPSAGPSCRGGHDDRTCRLAAVWSRRRRAGWAAESTAGQRPRWRPE